MAFPLSDAHFKLSFPTVAEDSLCGRASSPEEDVTTLFRQLRNPLVRYLLSFGLPEHDCEEVLQEAFLALFQHLQRGKSQQNLRGWLFRVAHNLGLKRRVAIHKERKEGMQSPEGTVLQPLDPALNPEEELASAQKQQRLRAVLKALPEQDQYCLVLRAEGLRYREIAEVLSISLGAVSLSLTRSLARLERASKV